MQIIKRKGFYECIFKNHSILAFTIYDLLNDLKTVYNIDLTKHIYNEN
jgi:hypothetical protein